MLTEVL